MTVRFLKEARDALERQAVDGSMPAGQNGPYRHKEAPLRNTGHWLISWSFAWQWTEESCFLRAAEQALEYLLDSKHRPSGHNWLQREQKGRDRCNGLIGAAWTIEALVIAHQLLGSKAALQEAAAVAAGHHFDSRHRLWKRLEVDGSILLIDQTLNHQVWFAASLGRLVEAGREEFRTNVEAFLDGLDQNFKVNAEGLIRHRIVLRPIDRLFIPGGLPHWLFIRYKGWKSQSAPIDARKRDVGYHAFNLHALALLKQRFPAHVFWSSKPLRRALDFTAGSVFREESERNNVYAYPYNPVGFEMALAGKVFGHNGDEADHWYDKQWSLVAGGKEGPYGEQAMDPETCRARLYEGCEYLKLKGERYGQGAIL
jgi:hypothetical protein